jgi:hypothetical protein
MACTMLQWFRLTGIRRNQLMRSAFINLSK